MRHLLRACSVVAVAVVLVGCWPQPGGGPDRRAHNASETAIRTDTVTDLREIWAADIGTVASDPVVVGGKLFVHTGDALFRINPATGHVVWVVTPDSPGIRFTGPVIVDGDRVVAAQAGSRGEYPAARWYDTETGEPDEVIRRGYLSSLRQPYGAFLSRESHPEGGNLTFLTVRNLEDDTDWWTLVGSRTTAVTVGDELVFDAGWGLNVTEPSNDPADIGVGVRAFPLAEHPGDCIEGLAACPVWANPLPSDDVSPAVLGVDGETLYVTTDTAVYAVAATTGEILWTGDGAADPLSPALADGRLYVPGTAASTDVYAAGGCDDSSCEPVWSAHTGREDDRVVTQPTVAGTGADAVLFTVSALGFVDGYAAAGCDNPAAADDAHAGEACLPLWSGNADDITTPPVVSNGRLFVGSEGGLVAFGLP